MMKTLFSTTFLALMLVCAAPFAVAGQEVRMQEESKCASCAGTVPKSVQRREPIKPVNPDESESKFTALAVELERAQVFFGGGSEQPVTFDSEAARQQGVSPQVIKLAKEMSAFTNDLMTIARATTEQNDSTAQSEAVKDKTTVVREKAMTALENYSALNSFFEAASRWQYKEAAKSDEEAAKSADNMATTLALFESPATVCGSFLTPRPSRSATRIQHTSSNPWNTLYQWGYHPTPDYVVWRVRAGGGWTRPRTYRSDLCKRNSFRDHAWIDGSRTIYEQKYTGWSPNGEPNPEVWNYSPWPYPAWPTYVFWWHQTH